MAEIPPTLPATEKTLMTHVMRDDNHNAGLRNSLDSLTRQNLYKTTNPKTVLNKMVKYAVLLSGLYDQFPH